MVKSTVYSLCLITSFMCSTILKVHATEVYNDRHSLRAFHTKTYNALPEVEEASEALKNSQAFDSFREEARALVVKYEIENKVGVRLVHKHTTLNKPECMIEDFEKFQGIDALVTRPQPLGQDETAHPASWIKGKSGYEVFEYSKDKKVEKIVGLLEQKPAFFTEFLALAKKYHLENILAPAILKRQWTNNFEGHIAFVEESYIDPTFSSVVTVKDLVTSSYSKDEDAISTAWFLTPYPPIATLRCVRDFHCVRPNFPGEKHWSKPSHDRR